MVKIQNKKAHLDYQLFDRFEAGMVLAGWEVKSLLDNRANLDNAFVKIINGEAFLINAYINPYQFANISESESRRTRKLLLHAKELLLINNKMKQNKLTLVPISVYNIRHKFKLEFALAKGKQAFEKRADIKKRDIQRDLEEEMANY